MRLLDRKSTGFTSLLAMLYLTIFASLAVGFYAATNTSTIIAHSEQDAAVALAATESGMDFMRYQLVNITLPYGTNASNLMNNTASVLGASVNGTPNMGGKTVVVTGSEIQIPSATGWITLDPTSKSRFRATISQRAGTNNLIVTVRGGSSKIKLTRAVRMEYKPSARSQALVGVSSVTMSLNAFTDSYNSSKGAYNAATAGKNGSISSNGNITISNNVKINGDARPGPGKTLTIHDSASVSGLRFPMASPVTYPSVVLPSSGVTSLGDVVMSSGTQNVPGGVYLIRNLNLSGTATINWTGPVTLYIQNSYSVTGSVVINAYQNNPKNRVINFLPTCTNATWSGTNTCVGDLYAPDTNFNVSGSVQKLGRIIAKTINNTSSGGMHADEALPQPGGMDSYQPITASYEEVQ